MALFGNQPALDRRRQRAEELAVEAVRSGTRAPRIAARVEVRSETRLQLPRRAKGKVVTVGRRAVYVEAALDREAREIRLVLNAEVLRALKLPELRDKLTQQGADPVGSTPEEFAAYIKAETIKWEKVVKASGAKAE